MNKTKKVLTISEVIKKRREDLSIRLGYQDLFIRILVLIIVGYLLFTQVFLLTQVRGNEMFPAIKDGDLILAFRLEQAYAKSDVVVYEVDGKTYIGRILAKENDIVTLDESGTLLVNGTVQSGEILFPTYATDTLEYPYRVPENCVFVLGDYRTQAIDSRELGPISIDDIEGKVITFLRRRGI